MLSVPCPGVALTGHCGRRARWHWILGPWLGAALCAGRDWQSILSLSEIPLWCPGGRGCQCQAGTRPSPCWVLSSPCGLHGPKSLARGQGGHSAAGGVGP